MLRRTLLKGLAASAAIGLRAAPAAADDVLKMGVSIPLTGAGFNAVGRQLAGALKLYVQQHGTNVAGRKIELIVRDDGGVADNARRIVQEMIVKESGADRHRNHADVARDRAAGDGSENSDLGVEFRSVSHR
jgi:branched-chain amino acid transport system substrate-binding protein